MYEIAKKRDEIMEYLKHAKELEGNIYAAQRICEQLRNRAAKLAIPKKIQEVEKPYAIVAFVYGLFASALPAIVSFFVVGVVATLVAVWVPATRGYIYFFIVLIPIGIIAIVLGGAWGEYVQKKKDYAVYCKEVEEEEQRVRIEEVAKRVLLKEAEIIEGKMQSSRRLLDSLYSLNVIHEKYRNLIAVTQLYEYFDTRRRETLEGKDGAYDLFEDELRKNIIIDRLNVIISQLDKLQRTQFLLFQELNKTNEMLLSLRNDIRSANITLQGIQNTAAITAFNSTVIARETGARNYINYYGR